MVVRGHGSPGPEPLRVARKKVMAKRAEGSDIGQEQRACVWQKGQDAGGKKRGELSKESCPFSVLQPHPPLAAITPAVYRLKLPVGFARSPQQARLYPWSKGGHSLGARPPRRSLSVPLLSTDTPLRAQSFLGLRGLLFHAAGC